MARAATETQKAGLTGLEFGLAIPGTVGGAVWANAGAHEATSRASSSRRPSCRPTARRRARRRRTSARLPRQPVQARRRRTPPRSSWTATFRLTPADPGRSQGRLDDIRRWRQAHQPLGLPSAGIVFRNPAGESAGRLIDEAGLKGTRIGGAVVSREARQLHRQRPARARRPTSAAWGSTFAAVGPRAARARASARDRVPRRLDRLGRGSSTWSGRMTEARVPPRPGHEAARTPVVVVFGGPSAEHDVSIVSGTAIAARCAPRATRWSSGWWTSTVDGGRCQRTTIVMAARAGIRRAGRLGCGRPHGPGQRARRARRARPEARRVPRPPRAVGRGRHGPGAPRGRRAALHRVRRDGPRDRHGQGDVQAARAAAWGCRSSTGARFAPRAGRATGTRSWPSSRPSPRAPAIRA